MSKLLNKRIQLKNDYHFKYDDRHRELTMLFLSFFSFEMFLPTSMPSLSQPNFTEMHAYTKKATTNSNENLEVANTYICSQEEKLQYSLEDLCFGRPIGEA